MLTTDDLILEYVYNLETKIKHLMNPHVLNCPNHAYHGLSREELLDKLLYLRNEGYIYFSVSNNIVKENFSDKSELGNIPFVDLWYVGMTEKGGIRWESLFNPLWEKYTYFEFGSLTNDLWSVTLETGTKEKMDSILQKYGNSITSISEVIELNPWHPVYWKSVDRGFVVTFHVLDNVMNDWELEKEINEINWRIEAW